MEELPDLHCEECQRQDNLHSHNQPNCHQASPVTQDRSEESCPRTGSTITWLTQLLVMSRGEGKIARPQWTGQSTRI